MNTNEKKRRQYIRHNADDMPIDVQLGDLVAHQREYLNDISLGGLSFKSHSPVPVGTVIKIKIPLSRPVFMADGTVIWCRKNNDRFDIGVRFSGASDHFKLRMIEQICHIERYKKELRQKEGKKLTGEQAALEWIKKYAAEFPRE